MQPFTIFKEGELTVTRFRSQVRFEDVLTAIVESESFHDALFEIWDLSYTGITFTSDQMASFAERARRKRRRPLKTAIVAHDDLSFGLSRVYSVHREQPGNETQVFRDEALAREWLVSED